MQGRGFECLAVKRQTRPLTAIAAAFPVRIAAKVGKIRQRSVEEGVVAPLEDIPRPLAVRNNLSPD